MEIPTSLFLIMLLKNLAEITKTSIETIRRQEKIISWEIWGG